MIDRSRLSKEQRIAVQHVTGKARVAAVIGFADAGKSTMLAAALDAWERQGLSGSWCRFGRQGGGGAGRESSGIASRTLTSWEYGRQAGRGQLGQGAMFSSSTRPAWWAAGSWPGS
ncbi:AAA family ATPase (plasmid) [Rhizobium sp. 32-5/1]|uniref:AAA family ATPase n=1 Tax=Rhizobium sp. 32-5/1 TaxID=3019602 RepID=UPI00240DEADC|nr:AAA family ATPase [Rhizobium sp. 32-5/1]WEZ86112.1 AAA family ATPase [Rhizobium sp. 32-5/1]